MIWHVFLEGDDDVGGEVKLKLFSLFSNFGWFFIFCAGMAKLGYEPSQ